MAKQQQWGASETVSSGDEMVRLGASGIGGGMAEGRPPWVQAAQLESLSVPRWEMLVA